MGLLFGLTDFIPWWCLCIAVFAAWFYWYGSSPYKFSQKYGWNGPKPEFLFGNTRSIRRMGGVFATDTTWPLLYGKVHVVYLGVKPAIVCYDADVLKQICVKQFSNFTDRGMSMRLEPLHRNGLFFLEGETWRFVRTVLTPTFTSGKMRTMNPLIQACVNSLKENMANYGKGEASVNMKEIFGAYTMDVIASIAFGLDIDSQKNPRNRFVTLAQKFFIRVRSDPMVWMTFLFPSLFQLLVRLGGTTLPKDTKEFYVSILEKTIAERKREENPRKDFLQLMIDASLDTFTTEGDTELENKELKTEGYDRKSLSELEIMAQAFLFIMAGYETTSTALMFTAYCFATNPEWQEKAIEEVDEILKGDKPTYDNVLKLEVLDMCINEVLRRHPPITRTIRSATEDMTIKGYHFVKDVMVIIPIYGIHHDPEYWPDPEVYDPNRFSKENKATRDPYRFLPFGLGPRNCIGMRLAQMEIKMAVAELLQNFRFKRAPETEEPLELDTENVAGVNKPKNDLYLRVESR